MVRRGGVTSVDNGTESSVYTDDPPAAWPGTQRPAPAPKAPWSGGGGRWTVWPMRIVLWAAILVIGYRGVVAIVLNEQPASKANSGAAVTSGGPSSQFPVTLAEAYVLNFGRVYLNFDPATATQRQQALAAFLPQGVTSAQPQFGWNGQGTMQMAWESIAAINVQNQDSAVVDLLATVNNKVVEFGVPVYAANGGLVISGLPALLPAPQTVQPPQGSQVPGDSTATSQLQAQLPLFFAAYASGNPTELARYVASGVSLAGLGGTVTYQSLGPMYVPQGGTTRDITVTVNWQLTGQQGGFATTYDMSVVELQGGRWYVKDIRASTQPMGTAS
jgi:hypothetical protein